MHVELRKSALDANLALASHGLALATFGNVSSIDRDNGVVAIKPSGVRYADLDEHQISVVRLEGGAHLSGMRPSSDTPTHLLLYSTFETIGGIAHSHSTYATSWAQAGKPIPCLGTTHADYFYGPVPCTRRLRDDECGDGYEHMTGEVIVETIANVDPLDVPAVLVASHGPFTWGTTAGEAVECAVALEEVARLALHTVLLETNTGTLPRALLDRHFQRKHGAGAYYGQA